MTIKVEREALLRVISRAPSGPSLTCEFPISPEDEAFVLVDIPKSYLNDALVPCSTYSDDDSLCTLSTGSLSTDSSIAERRVSFATPLVTDEWTRPFTAREDISKLFYSTAETNLFRQDYRLERKVLNDLSIDPDTFPVENEELSSIIATTSSCQPNSRHRISRVVVLHNDKLETFAPKAEVARQIQPITGDFFDNDSFWSGSITWY